MTTLNTFNFCNNMLQLYMDQNSVKIIDVK